MKRKPPSRKEYKTGKYTEAGTREKGHKNQEENAGREVGDGQMDHKIYQ